MLQRPSNWPAEAGELGKAGDILDNIGESYDINVGAIKADMVQDWADELNKDWAGAGGAKGARTKTASAASRELLDVLPAADRNALDRGDVETALRCLNIAQPAAGRLHDAKTKQAIDILDQGHGEAQGSEGRVAKPRSPPSATNPTIRKRTSTAGLGTAW